MKSFSAFLTELNVHAAYKKGGLKGAVHALKHNIRHRGVVGGSGIADNSTVGGGAHGAVFNRIGRETAAGQHTPARGKAMQDRVWGHYADKVNAGNAKLGVKPAYPERAAAKKK